MINSLKHHSPISTIEKTPTEIVPEKVEAPSEELSLNSESIPEHEDIFLTESTSKSTLRDDIHHFNQIETGNNPLFRKYDLQIGEKKANQALQVPIEIRSTNEHIKSVQSIRAELKAKNLPTISDEHTIRVFDLQESHGNEVTRVASGKAGFGESNLVELQIHVPQSDPLWNSNISSLNAGQVSLEQATQILAEKASRVVDLGNKAVADYINDTQFDRQNGNIDIKEDLRFLNMSWVMTPAEDIYKILSNLTKNDEMMSSPLAQDLIVKLSPYKEHFGWTSNTELLKSDQAFLMIGNTLKEQLSSPQFKNEISQKKKNFSHTLESAESENILVFSAAGNMGTSSAYFGEFFGQNVFSDVEPLLVIGASDIGEANNTDDDKIATFSSPGADFVVNGVDLPVGEVFTDVSGSSHATPLAITVATLMSTAYQEMHHDQKFLNAKQMSTILSYDFIYDDLAGENDGRGALDIIAAIELARDWDQFQP